MVTPKKRQAGSVQEPPDDQRLDGDNNHDAAASAHVGISG
jgi:hypothetical protein